MKILIVGLGSIGRRHLKNLATLGIRQLAAVTQRRCALPDDQLPPYLPVDTLKAGLDWAPDAVFVCNPTAFHLETALEIARAGRHLFLEKPVSHDQNDLNELQGLIEAQALVAQVGFQFRYFPVFQRIRQAIAQNAIGKVVSAHAHWAEYLPGWHPWEDYRQSYSARADLGGGALLTLCHPFDYLRWMVGEYRVIGAIGGQLSHLDLDTEDVALVTLQFENSAVGMIYVDYIAKPPKHTLLIIGTAGRIEWDADFGSAKIYSDVSGTTETVSPGRYFERNEWFLAEVADFLDCIRQNGRPQCMLSDGITALDHVCTAKSLLSPARRTDTPSLASQTAQAIW